MMDNIKLSELSYRYSLWEQEVQEDQKQGRKICCEDGKDKLDIRWSGEEQEDYTDIYIQLFG